MALLKNKMTAQANESQMPWNLNLPIVVAEECDETSAMLDKLMDESWEWEQKFLAMKKDYEDEKFLRNTLLDLNDPKKVAKHLNALTGKLTGQTQRMYGDDVEGWAKRQTKFIRENWESVDGHPNPDVWSIYREIKLICERLSGEFEGHHGRKIADDAWEVQTGTRPLPITGYKFVGLPHNRRLVQHETGRMPHQSVSYYFEEPVGYEAASRQTKEEFVNGIEAFIHDAIKVVVRRAGRESATRIIQDWGVLTPGLKRAQLRIVAKHLVKWGKPARTPEGKNKMKKKDLLALGRSVGLDDADLKGTMDTLKKTIADWCASGVVHPIVYERDANNIGMYIRMKYMWRY